MRRDDLPAGYQEGAAPLLRGYVRGLVFAERRPTEELIRLMSELEAAHPQMAVDILVFGGDDFDALNRVIGLVESKAVPPRFLASFAMGIGPPPIDRRGIGPDPAVFRGGACSDADTASGGRAVPPGILEVRARPTARGCLEKPGVRSHAWRLVEAALPYVESGLAYDWSEIVKRLAEFDLGRAAILLGQAFLSDSLEVFGEARKRLIEMIPRNAELVMEGFGRALLDPVHGWRLQIHVLRDLVSRIPSHVVLAWVKRHGVDGARAIARHLPIPSLDDDGHAVVPEVLDAILRDYGDEQVLNNFSAGVHSGESWWGDGPTRIRREIENARQLLHHPNRWIRRWARQEIDERTRIAEREEREHAEAALPG